jgi:hypothetical protein
VLLTGCSWRGALTEVLLQRCSYIGTREEVILQRSFRRCSSRHAFKRALLKGFSCWHAFVLLQSGSCLSTFARVLLWECFWRANRGALTWVLLQGHLFGSVQFLTENQTSSSGKVNFKQPFFSSKQKLKDEKVLSKIKCLNEQSWLTTQAQNK